MLKRNIDLVLSDWKTSTTRQPLLVRGARQTGKTSSVIHFGKTSFNNIVIVNFEENPEFSKCFSSLDVFDILEKISILAGVEIIPGKTLLFLDEIQECPVAIVSLRYFYEKMPKLHVIGAGSLVEFALKSSDFRMPVGRISSIFMEPMTFFEFLDAVSHQKLRKYLETVDIQNGIDPVFHEKLSSLLRKYLIVGGMPGVVSAYAANASPEQVKILQLSILQTYQADFAKYASTSQHKYLKDVFLTAPRLTGSQCKYSHINPHVQSRYLKDALKLLTDARCLHQVFHSGGTGIPLESQVNPKKFKLLFLDAGLMQRSLGLDTKLMLDNDIMTINRGSVSEQFIGQQLMASTNYYEERKIYFWAREKKGSNAEVDFLVHLNSEVFPVEVKSGKTGTLKSMRIFLKEHPKSPFGLRFSMHELSMHDQVLSIPLYMAGQWKRLCRSLINH